MVSLVLAATLAAAAPDRRNDFDFETGTWSIDVARSAQPFVKPQQWSHPRGYLHVVRKLFEGASLAQLEATQPAPHVLGLMLRMYDAKTQTWSVYWGNAGSGALDPPLIGRFVNGRGEFLNHDTVDGRRVLVRVVYSNITATSFHTEQALSTDGGKTWVTNLVQTFTRIK